VTAAASLFTQRFVQLFFGYVVAVFVATMVALLFMTLPDIFDRDRRDLSGDMFLTGLMVTFPTALPGFGLAIGFAIGYRWRAWFAYALAGAANAVLALWILGRFLGGSILQDPRILVACLAGGFVGGLAFWAVGGGRAGFWRGEGRP
jgi:hypothetical protein